jgi:hypothetical protein
MVLVLQRLLSHTPPPVGHRFELDPAAALPDHLHAAGFDPPPEVLALADVEDLEVSAAFDDGFDARTRHADAPAHGQVAELEQVQGDAAERGI